MTERSRRIAVSMITGDDWRKEEIKCLLESLEPHCHALYVNWNGTKRKPRWGAWTSMPIHYVQTKWEDDFAAARNAAYHMIPKKDFGWWLWLDTDDILVAPEGFAPILDDIDPYTRGVFMRYAYAIEPNTGHCVVEQWRERLMSTDWVWMWKWPIHEVCVAPQGTQFTRADGELGQKVYIEHLRKSGEDRGARERNRRIIMKAYRQYPNEPRYAYYFANECLAEAENSEPGPRKVQFCDSAIVAYQKFLGMRMMPSDDTYGASVRVGELFYMKEDYTGAVDAYLQAARFYPDWPDAWVGCAKALLQLQDWRRMYAFANIACNLEKPNTSAAIENMNYDFNPLVLRGIANQELGNLKEALSDYKAARKIYDDPEAKLEARIKVVQQKLKEPKREDPWEVRKRTRGTKREKSICFYTNPIAETWNQDTLKAGGHGGSETLVLEMAPCFAADGWRVSVFGCPGDDHRGLGSDGVEYWRSEDWLPIEPYTVFVSSRAITPFGGPIDSKAKFLWMHDVNLGPSLRSIVSDTTKIIPISNWHAQHLQSLYGIPSDHMHVIPNWLDMSLYPEREEYSDGHRFIWSSSPDRGLEHLLALWPLIRERWSDATLEVFYGWDFIDKILSQMPNHPTSHLKYLVGQHWEELGGEDAGLYWYGRQPPAVLAEHQLQSDIWAYPTGFMETFCLTAIQSQAAGCIPVTTALAALNENVACDYLKINGWCGNVDYQNRYLELLETLLADDEPARDLREQTRRIGRTFSEQFSLDAAYSNWNNLFKEVGVKV